MADEHLAAGSIILIPGLEQPAALREEVESERIGAALHPSAERSTSGTLHFPIMALSGFGVTPLAAAAAQSMS
mgnify:CR=1 FL=1